MGIVELSVRFFFARLCYLNHWWQSYMWLNYINIESHTFLRAKISKYFDPMVYISANERSQLICKPSQDQKKPAILTQSKTKGHIIGGTYNCTRKFPEIFGSRSKVQDWTNTLFFGFLMLDQDAGLLAPSSSVWDSLSGWCRAIAKLLSDGALVKNDYICIQIQIIDSKSFSEFL